MVASGFADPALDAQAVFRGLLGALAEPGVTRRMPPERPRPPPPLSSGLYAAALALVDWETPVWLAPELRDAASDLRFQTGAPIVEQTEKAAFALVGRQSLLPPLDGFAQGSHDYPDRSTTLLVEVQALESGGGWTLTGPGIEHEVRLHVAGLPPDFERAWAANRERFPLGVDLVLFAGDLVVGLPRTTRLAEV